MIWIQPWIWLTDAFVCVFFPLNRKRAFTWIISTYQYNNTQFSCMFRKKKRYGYGKGFLYLDKIFQRECTIPCVPCFFQDLSYYLLQIVQFRIKTTRPIYVKTRTEICACVQNLWGIMSISLTPKTSKSSQNARHIWRKKYKRY